LTEDTSAQSGNQGISTWGWADCYPDSAQRVTRTVETGVKCQNLGLSNDPSTDSVPTTDDGLIKKIDDILGVEATPTGLYLAFSTADYE
jgi:hypothetical protein